MSQTLPLSIGIAPFPEGFEGDMDETFQQAVQLMDAFVEGNFLTGLVLPPGSSLPTTDQGPVAVGNVWYFWDASTGQYLPQTVSSKMAKNYVKNSTYQIQQVVVTTIGAGIIKHFDLSQARASAASVLAVAPDVGPVAGADNDNCLGAIKYTVGPTLVPTPAATDLYVHEHLIEGSDLAVVQGQTLSLSFSVWTNVPGTYSVYLANNGRDQSYVANFSISAPQASSWVRVKINAIPAFPTAGTWSYSEGVIGLYIGIGMLVGTQWRTANANQWNSGIYCGTAQNSNLCTVVNNQMKITGIKLEASSAVSYLQVNSFDADFWECLRYYYTTFVYQSLTAGIGIIGNAHIANAAWFSYTFPRRMAKIPTVVPYGWTSHAAGNITNISTGTDFAIAALASGQKGFSVGASPTTTAKGDVFLTYITADARL